MRRRKILILLVPVAVIGVWYGIASYAEAQPKIERWGEAKLEILSDIRGQATAASPDGKTIAIERLWKDILISKNGGKWEELKGLPPYDRSWVSHIGSDGAIYGGFEKTRPYSFLIDKSGSLRTSWPNLKEEVYINDSTPDNRVLLGTKNFAHSRAVAFQDGQFTEFPSGQWDLKQSYVSQISDDGRVAIGLTARQNSGNEPCVWRDGVREPFQDDKPSGLPRHATYHAMSRNGKFFLVSFNNEVRLYDDTSYKVIFDAKPPEPSLKEKFAKWWSGMFASKPKAPSNVFTIPMNSLSLCYVSEDGRLVIGQHMTGMHGENLEAVAWTPEDGWVPIANELRKRGVQAPPGWKVDGIREVSRDGTTLVGHARRGDDISPMIIRFRTP